MRPNNYPKYGTLLTLRLRLLVGKATQSPLYFKNHQTQEIFSATCANLVTIFPKLVKAVANPKVSIIATGSEVSVAMKAAEKLEAEGIATQVVSAPCLEWLAEQDGAYRESLLPKSALKVSIEAGIAQGWREYVGDNGVIISLDHFGASASAAKLFEEFGFGTDAVVAKIKAAL